MFLLKLLNKVRKSIQFGNRFLKRFNTHFTQNRVHSTYELVEEGGCDLVVDLTELPHLLLAALVSVIVGDVVGDRLLSEHRVLRNMN